MGLAGELNTPNSLLAILALALLREMRSWVLALPGDLSARYVPEAEGPRESIRGRRGGV